jgi:hypothetical protein
MAAGGARAGAGTLSFTLGGPVGAALEHAAPAFLKGWKAEGTPTLEVACVPLQALLDSTGLHDVDLLSLDVEGAELAVLETLDFSVVNIRVALVELDGFDAAKDDAVRALFAREGFVPSAWGSPRDYCVAGGECTLNDVFFNPRFVERRAARGGRAWAPAPAERLVPGTGMRCPAASPELAVAQRAQAAADKLLAAQRREAIALAGKRV